VLATSVSVAASRPDELARWAPAAFPLLFLAAWLVVTTLVAWFAGHMKLVARFPPRRERTTEVFRWVSGRMRWVTFNGGLHVGVGARGLHLAPGWLFRPLVSRGIPCIPWSEIRLVGAHTPGMLGQFRGSRFEIPAVKFSFTLYGEAGRSVEQRLLASEGAPPPPRRPLVRET
jgi:hypothetical protein